MRVSWHNLTLSIIVWDREHQSQHSVAETELWIESDQCNLLPSTSDILGYLEQHSGRMNINEIPSLLHNINANCNANQLGISLRFPYFRSRTTAIKARFDVSRVENGRIDFTLHLSLTLPHQREIEVAIQSAQFIWIESLEEALCDLPTLPSNQIHDEVMNRLNAFNPTWCHVNYSEAQEMGLRQSLEWQWPSNNATQTAPSTSADTFKEYSKPPLIKSFGEWLRTERSYRKLSQQELAIALQISNSNLSRVESGLKAPTRQMLDDLAKHWGYDLEHILLRARQPSHKALEQIAADIEGFTQWMNRQ